MQFPEQILNEFDPISLEEMDDVKLLDRTDTKYILASSQLPSVLSRLSKSYRVLEVNGARISRYETLYYDTEDFQLYLAHQNKKANRYKIRARKYVDSDLHFFEIKLKNNKGRTIKERVKTKSIKETLGEKASAFLRERTQFDPAAMKPKIWVNYTRITLVNTDTKERVTIDSQLCFEKDKIKKPFGHIAIVEVKQAKASTSVFGKLMREMHIESGSMSKYCIGVTQFYDSIKKNNFKPRLLFLNKIAHAIKY
ncbi:MAG: polyphosphate polymerase domain-containing protein [Cytophagaceae bacterium]